MSPWQIAKAIKYYLGTAEWPDSPGNQVFTPQGVFVTAGVPEEAIARVRVPCAIVRVLEAENDDEHPQLITQYFEVIIIQISQSDAMGEHLLVGGPKSNGPGASEGRGLLELEEEVRRAVEKLNRTNGVTLKIVQVGALEVAEVSGMGFVGTRTVRLEAVCLRARSFPACSSLTATDAGGGAVDLSWSVPSLSRYDKNKVELWRKSGSAPVQPGDGTQVALATDLATSVRDTPGSGEWYYSVFMGYDTDGDGTNDEYSSRVTAVVTVA